MREPWGPPQIVWVVVLSLAMFAPARVHGQLPSPARDAAEEVLQLIRSGDEGRLRGFIESRFTPEYRDAIPMEEHLRLAAAFREDLRGRDVAEVEVWGPTEASMILEGAGDRLEMRLQVEPDPPYRIHRIHVWDAGPVIGARALDGLGRDLERLADRDEFSGVVLVASAGRIRLHEAHGFADREMGRRNRANTRFDLGSIYKLFTATAVLRLVQDGRLGLTDPVGEYLGGFRPEVAEQVTVEQLLRHRSGFGDYLTHPDFEADPKRFNAPADFLPLARRQELAFDPGSGSRYSNMGYVLLGAIIESVTGRDYHEMVGELVFRPARMATAGPTGGAEAARRYHRMPGEWMRVDAEYPDVGTPAGGGFAAAEDLHRFVEALLGHTLLDEDHTALLLNRFEAPAMGASLPDQIGFAGGAPGVHAILLARPAERQTVVVLANLEPLAIGALARRITYLAISTSDLHDGGSREPFPR